MKKMVLTTLGLVGVCAACCAIPLAVPIIGAISVSGFSLLTICQLLPTPVGIAMALAISMGVAVWAASWYMAQRRKHAAIAHSTTICPLPASNDGWACGCAKGVS